MAVWRAVAAEAERWLEGGIEVEMMEGRVRRSRRRRIWGRGVEEGLGEGLGEGC